MARYRPAVLAAAAASVRPAATAVLTLALLLLPGGVGQLAEPAPPAPGQPPAGRPAVAAPAAELRLGSETVQQYGRVELAAAGFAPGEEVTLAVAPADRSGDRAGDTTGDVAGDGTAVELGRATADERGEVAALGLDLPASVTSGARELTARGASSGRTAAATIHVRAERPFAILSSYTPRPGERLGFVVGGFEPEEEVEVRLGDLSLTAVATDRAGNVAWAEVPLPVVEPGERALTFAGRRSGAEHVERVAVAPLAPSLELSPWFGPPGAQITLNGRGFLPGEEVQAFLGAGGPADAPALSFRADEYGNYWGVGPLTVPADANAGRLEVRLLGRQSGARISQPFSVAGDRPWAELSAYSGLPGSAVGFGGGGFGARERVAVHLGSRSGPLVAVAQTDENGGVVRSDVAVVPADPAARTPTNVTYTLVGEESRREASAVFTVVPFVLTPP